MTKTKKPVVAIMYDFDKTLSTTDMQEYSFIPKLNMTPKEFWEETDRLAREENMDRILAYLRLMLKKAAEKGVAVTRDKFVELGKDIVYFPGVTEWFSRINDFGKKYGVVVEHYVISSGLKEIIEGSSIYKNFKRVYACEFLYDHNGVAAWLKTAVNYTNKTQFLFRINKGALDLYEDAELNGFTDEENRRVPFRNMIYVGDGMTDVPCMKLVKLNGGQSIAVFKKRKKETAEKLIRENRVDYITEANFCDGSELDDIVKTAIEKIAAEDKLVRLHLTHLKSIKNM